MNVHACRRGHPSPILRKDSHVATAFIVDGPAGGYRMVCGRRNVVKAFRCHRPVLAQLECEKVTLSEHHRFARLHGWLWRV